jgi:hypothetical protein
MEMVVSGETRMRYVRDSKEGVMLAAVAHGEGKGRLLSWA